ncbi:MAG: hypothetical protein KC593_12590 [Myxococcales bacterium]|nr:hypothetical protein [Myxococcales bacterium]
MSTSTREHEYVVLSHASDPPREIARLWWDGERVQCEPESYLDRIDMLPMFGTVQEVNGRLVSVPAATVECGVAFLEELPRRFRNGYTTCRRVR